MKSILLPMTYKGAILTPYLSAINFRKIEFGKLSSMNLIFGLFRTLQATQAVKIKFELDQKSS